jgi:cytochrome c2
MKNKNFLVCLFTILLCLNADFIFSQNNDPVLKTEGQKIFEDNCTSCHAVDKMKLGPPLQGISKKMSPEIIKKFLHTPYAFNLEKELFYKSNDKYFHPYVHTKMSFPSLTNTEIEALVRYVEKIPEPIKKNVATTTEIKATSSGLTDRGIFDLQIGKSFESVKHLLEKDPVEKHYSILEKEYYKQQKGDFEEEGELKKDAYRVKLTEKKYYQLWEIPVKSIEVRFDSKKNLMGILIMMEKSEKNINGLRIHLEEQFGAFNCSQAVDNANSFYCVKSENPEETNNLNFYTFDGFAELSINDYLYIRYCKDDPKEPESSCY